MLCQIDERCRLEADTLLNWLAYVESPPSSAQLAEASAIDLVGPTGDGEVDIENRGDVEDTLEILAGLVVIAGAEAGTITPTQVVMTESIPSGTSSNSRSY